MSYQITLWAFDPNELFEAIVETLDEVTKFVRDISLDRGFVRYTFRELREDGFKSDWSKYSNDDMQQMNWALDAKVVGTELKTFVQYKGTDLCMDAWCQCGNHFHIDGYFAHQIQCDECKRVYELSTRLLVREVTGDDINSPIVGK